MFVVVGLTYQVEGALAEVGGIRDDEWQKRLCHTRSQSHKDAADKVALEAAARADCQRRDETHTDGAQKDGPTTHDKGQWQQTNTAKRP